MKYDKLTIIGLPKKFKVYYALDYLYPDGQLPDNPDDILYDEWPTDGDEGEDAMMAYEYNKSATGVYVAYNETVHALSLELSPWASDADVSLYVKLVNAVLKKHPRAKLYAQYDILKGLTEEDEKKMIADRQSHVKRLLKTKDGFTMDGLFHGFTLKVAHLRPAPTLDIQARELRQMFADMQWDKEEESYKGYYSRKGEEDPKKRRHKSLIKMMFEVTKKTIMPYKTVFTAMLCKVNVLMPK